MANLEQYRTDIENVIKEYSQGRVYNLGVQDKSWTPNIFLFIL